MVPYINGLLLCSGMKSVADLMICLFISVRDFASSIIVSLWLIDSMYRDNADICMRCVRRVHITS